MHLPNRKNPCKDCPFRKDSMRGWLPRRIKQIIESDSFVCHKNNSLQCAGHLILMKESNQFYRLAKALGLDLGLKNEHLIFDSPEDCIKHHQNAKEN